KTSTQPWSWTAGGSAAGGAACARRSAIASGLIIRPGCAREVPPGAWSRNPRKTWTSVARQLRSARWRHAMLRRLLEREGEADQPGLAERRSGERHAERRLFGDEAGRKGDRECRWEEPARHDHARVSSARRRVRSEVRGEEHRVELLSQAALALVGERVVRGHPVLDQRLAFRGELLRTSAVVQDVEHVSPRWGPDGS